VYKKFLAALILLLMIAAPTSAMRLELYPQPIGKISVAENDTLQIIGASKISGKNLGNDTYAKGIAIFGNKNFPRNPENTRHYSDTYDTFFAEKLFCHFDAAKKICSFGDCDIKNTVAIKISPCEREIYVINNTAGRNLFLLKEDIGTGDGIKIIGTKDGKWLEFLDARDLREKYNVGYNFRLTKCFTEDNKIIFRYTLNDHVIDVVCRWHAANQEFYTEAIEQ
jgi:hypothetical protein